MKKTDKWVFYGLLLIVFGVIFPNNPTQVSTSYFFKHHLENTTHVDIFDNGLAKIYMNNATTPSYFLNTTEETNFEYKLKHTNYHYDTVHKKTPKKSNGSDYILLFI